MAVLHRITPERTAEYKEVRLRALRDSPAAFCSTYAGESALADEEWDKRTQRLDGVGAIGYLAFDGVRHCGIAACFPDEEDALLAHLRSMWVAPEARRDGVGSLLVEAIAGWARERGAKTLALMVTSSNDGAIRFYESLGFVKTGRTEPYPNDTALLEYEMVRQLA